MPKEAKDGRKSKTENRIEKESSRKQTGGNCLSLNHHLVTMPSPSPTFLPNLFKDCWYQFPLSYAKNHLLLAHKPA